MYSVAEAVPRLGIVTDGGAVKAPPWRFSLEVPPYLMPATSSSIAVVSDLGRSIG